MNDNDPTPAQRQVDRLQEAVDGAVARLRAIGVEPLALVVSTRWAAIAIVALGFDGDPEQLADRARGTFRWGGLPLVVDPQLTNDDWRLEVRPIAP